MKFNSNASAEFILDTPLDHPERIFSSPSTMRDEYKILAKKWHPDVVGDLGSAEAVLAHINVLFKNAKDKPAYNEFYGASFKFSKP